MKMKQIETGMKDIHNIPKHRLRVVPTHCL